MCGVHFRIECSRRNFIIFWNKYSVCSHKIISMKENIRKKKRRYTKNNRWNATWDLVFFQSHPQRDNNNFAVKHFVFLFLTITITWNIANEWERKRKQTVSTAMCTYINFNFVRCHQIAMMKMSYKEISKHITRKITTFQWWKSMILFIVPLLFEWKKNAHKKKPNNDHCLCFCLSSLWIFFFNWRRDIFILLSMRCLGFAVFR